MLKIVFKCKIKSPNIHDKMTFTPYFPQNKTHTEKIEKWKKNILKVNLYLPPLSCMSKYLLSNSPSCAHSPYTQKIESNLNFTISRGRIRVLKIKITRGIVIPLSFTSHNLITPEHWIKMKNQKNVFNRS